MSEINLQSEQLVLEPAFFSMTLDEALAYAVKDPEYAYFEGSEVARTLARVSFVDGVDYLPGYQYHKLESYTLNDSLAVDAGGGNLGASIDEKLRLRTCISIIQNNRGDIGEDVADLYIGKLETELEKQYLVEAAALSHKAGNAEARAMWRQKFVEHNEVLYGAFDRQALLSILATERMRIDAFVPQNETAQKLKQELQDFFTAVPEAVAEGPLLDAETIAHYQEVINEKYSDIFAAIPDTDESVIYNSSECAEIMNDTLKAGGLYDAGWRAEVHPNKAIVATNPVTKRIYLPKNTQRNAHQLRKLVLHEQEVHARRAFNGAQTGVAPLEVGTANYADVEEGLGVILESILDGNIEGVAVTRARDRYIAVGLAIGADTDGSGRDARQTFEILWRLMAIRGAKGGAITEETVQKAQFNRSVSNSCAMSHVDNIYRGTDFAGAGIIYTKAKVYRDGFVKNAQLLTQIVGDRQQFDALFVGKHDHTDRKEAELAQTIAKRRHKKL